MRDIEQYLRCEQAYEDGDLGHVWYLDPDDDQYSCIFCGVEPEPGRAAKLKESDPRIREWLKNKRIQDEFAALIKQAIWIEAFWIQHGDEHIRHRQHSLIRRIIRNAQWLHP